MDRADSSEVYAVKEHVPGFLIQYKTDRNIPTNYHYHSGYEIVWLKAGKARYIFEDKVYSLKKDSILLFKSSEFHRVYLPEHTVYERVVVMFTDDFFSMQHTIMNQFQHLFESLSSPHLMWNAFIWQTDHIQPLFDALIEETNHPKRWMQQSAIEIYLLQLLLFLCREMEEREQLQPQSLKVNSSDQLSPHDNIIQAMNEIWNKDWKLDDLADKLHFNKYYLCHFFKKEFGVTVQEYILQRRMFEAMKMLHYKNLTVQQIAEYVGFQSASSFIRRFKNHVGVTPNQYRKSKRK
ncbi:AraC family transcriptional regulator [Gracilibacillus halophilus YIM-C55.5]|uniref:AraC family transcriptional regulator n=1 Tax=Gracilibacillus halophilus YIM-C55.5 TaxID=1308866 RepID=N4WCZ1_9BACI|nr:helix-turn-helix domain-containing protein [Gracilibacillus halophilus]ENH97084.1 AraC family transcriptional regulator [Gracilibacillus halophilus YIM-C55.5]